MSPSSISVFFFRLLTTTPTDGDDTVPSSCLGNSCDCFRPSALSSFMRLHKACGEASVGPLQKVIGWTIILAASLLLQGTGAPSAFRMTALAFQPPLPVSLTPATTMRVQRLMRRRLGTLAPTASSSSSLSSVAESFDTKYDKLMQATPLSLAPMMEYTDRYFRHLVRLISNRTCFLRTLLP